MFSEHCSVWKLLFCQSMTLFNTLSSPIAIVLTHMIQWVNWLVVDGLRKYECVLRWTGIPSSEAVLACWALRGCRGVHSQPLDNHDASHNYNTPPTLINNRSFIQSLSQKPQTANSPWPPKMGPNSSPSPQPMWADPKTYATPGMAAPIFLSPSSSPGFGRWSTQLGAVDSKNLTQHFRHFSLFFFLGWSPSKPNFRRSYSWDRSSW